MPKTIKLDIHGIVVELGEKDPLAPACSLGGTIKSDLVDDTLTDKNPFNVGMEALESMILACACAGIDIETNAFGEAIETVADKIANEWGD